MKTVAKIFPRRIDAATGVIDIEGDVNVFAEPALMDAYADLSEQGIKKVILNFKNMNYMNSQGIGLLVKLLIHATREENRLLACELSEHYREILRVTRLDGAIQVFATEQQALASG